MNGNRLKIVGYRIFEGYVTTVELKVMDFINQGWRPRGAPIKHDAHLIQAMIKYEEKEETE